MTVARIRSHVRLTASDSNVVDGEEIIEDCAIGGPGMAKVRIMGVQHRPLFDCERGDVRICHQVRAASGSAETDLHMGQVFRSRAYGLDMAILKPTFDSFQGFRWRHRIH